MSWTLEMVAAAHASLTTSDRESLWRRGVSDEQIDTFQMGILPGAMLPATVAAPPKFQAWWAVHRERFRNPLVFPLTSTLGSVHGLQFRDLDPKRKGYMDYFECKEEPALFGLAQAMPHVWVTDAVWLVEGVFDLCPVQRHVPNVISTLHAGVSNQLRRLLHRVARKLVVAYDMDSTGRKVSNDMARDLRDVFDVKVVCFPRVRLPTGNTTKDPNDLWSVWGDKPLGEFIERLGA